MTTHRAAQQSPAWFSIELLIRCTLSGFFFVTLLLFLVNELRSIEDASLSFYLIVLEINVYIGTEPKKLFKMSIWLVPLTMLANQNRFQPGEIREAIKENMYCT
jgi:hypothetical protein